MIMNLPALAGTLLGAMLDPATWSVAFIVTYGARDKSIWARLAISMVIVAIISLLTIPMVRQFGGDSARPIVFALISTLIWCLIGDVFLRWRRRANH